MLKLNYVRLEKVVNSIKKVELKDNEKYVVASEGFGILEETTDFEKAKKYYLRMLDEVLDGDYSLEIAEYDKNGDFYQRPGSIIHTTVSNKEIRRCIIDTVVIDEAEAIKYALENNSNDVEDYRYLKESIDEYDEFQTEQLHEILGSLITDFNDKVKRFEL